MTADFPTTVRERGACHGNETRQTRSFMEYMEECQVCGAEVRHDLVDHPFFGFKASCDYEEQPDD